MLLLIWAEANGFTLPDDLTAILEASQCNNCQTDETKRLRMEVTAMANTFLDEGDPQSVAEAIKCLPCLKPGQIQAAISYLKCKYWAGVTRE